MKTKKQVEAIVEMLEAIVPAGDRGPALMALEWVLGCPISTSLSFEDWIEQYVEEEASNG